MRTFWFSFDAITGLRLVSDFVTPASVSCRPGWHSTEIINAPLNQLENFLFLTKKKKIFDTAGRYQNNFQINFYKNRWEYFWKNLSTCWRHCHLNLSATVMRNDGVLCRTMHRNYPSANLFKFERPLGWRLSSCCRSLLSLSADDARNGCPSGPKLVNIPLTVLFPSVNASMNFFIFKNKKINFKLNFF